MSIEGAINADCFGFIDWLRDRAIAAKWPERLIRKLDDLQSADELEADLAERDGQLSDKENAFDNLYDELSDLVAALQIDRETAKMAVMDDDVVKALQSDRTIQSNLNSAIKALERHKQK